MKKIYIKWGVILGPSLAIVLWSVSLLAAKVELGSLQGLSDHEVEKLARTLSAVTAPKILVHNEALGWRKFDVGFEQALYHISSNVRNELKNKALGHSDVDAIQYLFFMNLRMGLPLGLDTEAALFLPKVVENFVVTSASIKWVPPLLANDKLFFTPGFRQSYTYTKFSQYRSDTWTTDLILSTKKIYGIPFYGGGSFMKISGEYNNKVVRASHTRQPDIWTGRYFFGLDTKWELFKNIDFALAMEAAFMTDSQAYSLKTTLNF